ncbi:MAG: hypothetical protein PHZ27_04515 [Candidatus Omnitrophica bacterium]|nr:hypothetical protein [Candidatus Omnitrophota bacterium]
MAVKDKLFFIVGGENSQRKAAFENIKSEISKNNIIGGVLFFYPDNVTADKFKEDVFTFSFSGQKVVVLRQVESMPVDVKKILVDNLTKILDFNYIVAESELDFGFLSNDRKLAKDPLISLLITKAASTKFNVYNPPPSIDDFKKNLRTNNINGILFALEKIYVDSKGRDFGPQILGMLNYKFGYIKNPAIKQRKLKYLWDADRLMKTGGEDSRVILNTLIMKLFA